MNLELMKWTPALKQELIDMWIDFANKYPIISLEDGMSEKDAIKHRGFFIDVILPKMEIEEEEIFEAIRLSANNMDYIEEGTNEGK